MQKSFKINSSIYSYKVLVGYEYTSYLKEVKDNYVVIIDEKLLSKHNSLCQSSNNFIAIEAKEENKDLANISNIISEIKKFSLRKDSILIGIGGGIIQDITCFISSIYMRGINWVYIPTTFLGICDSCIGGKSSINVNGIKNLVGNFNPPQEVIIDFSFLKSLNNSMIDSGLCEALKICFAYHDNKVLECFNNFFENKKIDYLENITALSLETKKWFIEKDEFDKNERKLLNFGHTFGHAIESQSNYQIPHGIAVGFGMLWAIFISNIYFKNIDNNRVIILLKSLQNLLKTHTNFCKIIEELSVDKIYQSFIFDKKHNATLFNCILINEDGFVTIKSFNKDQEFIENFKLSYNELKKFISL